MHLQLIKSDLLPLYQKQVNPIDSKFQLLQDAEISTANFSFYTSVASVFSSKIEGESVEIDSYIKHKGMGIAFRADYTQKIDDLYEAYIFAQNNNLSAKNIAKAHTLLAKHLVAKNYLGKLRNQNMYVANEDGQIEYVAISPYELKKEMDKFYQDIAVLIKQKLSIEEVFYYSAFIHLVFVKIHPWNDGNGRCARLIEKWFISQHLGEKAWYLQSEKNYYQNHQLYYHNLRALGIEYEQLNYSKALPFLLMLPKSLEL